MSGWRDLDFMERTFVIAFLSIAVSCLWIFAVLGLWLIGGMAGWWEVQ